MLRWIPFRAENLTDTFELYGRLLNPNTLIGMGLRENTYLIAAMVMASFALAWSFAHLVLPRLQRSVLWYPARVIQYTVMVALILVFLRPINQFIYFQF